MGKALAIHDGENQDAEVVGVMANSFFTNSHPPEKNHFVVLAAAQASARPGEVVLCVRHLLPGSVVAPAIRAAVRDADPRIPIFTLHTMQDQLENMMGPVRMIATLLGVFALAALLLAAIGLYAVIAFHLSRRTRDLGIRMALGASSRQILRGVLGEGLRLTAAGLVAGLLLSAAVGRGLKGLLFGVTPTDAVTYGGVFVLLAAVALLACYLPARRAAAIDPTVALRQE